MQPGLHQNACVLHNELYYNEILLFLFNQLETTHPLNSINLLMDSLYLRNEWVGLDDL